MENSTIKKTNHFSTKNILSWILGVLLCTLGVSLCTKASFGLSMIGAPPYILHIWLRGKYAWFTQGTAEYVWEAIILLIMCLIIRQFRARYLLSFVTAVISGFCIDGWLFLLGGNGPYTLLISRIIAFACGELLTALAIAFFFRTTLPQQVYELAVMEISGKFGFDKTKVKYANDGIMLVLAMTLSLLLTHRLTGVGVGTVIITFVNAPLIAFFGKILERLGL